MATNMRKTLFPFLQSQRRFLTGRAPPSSSPASSPLSPNSASLSLSAVQFLINSCGLSSKSALLTSQKLHLDEKCIQKIQSRLQFLKSHNFDDTDVAKLIEKRPRVLRCSIKGNLKPKFDFLIENGFVGELLPQLIVSNPQILETSLDSQIKLTFQLLKSFLHVNDNVMLAIKRSSWLLTSGGSLRKAIDFLRNEGMPVDRIKKLIIWQPRTILQKPDRMVDAVNYLKNLGLQPENSMFTRALHVMLGMSESTWRKKIEVMKSLGWSEDEILGIFKRCPTTLACSEKKIRSATDFLMNAMRLERQIICTYPYLLGFSIEKRIRPRYHVIKVLESKELLVKGDKKITTLLMISEKKFLDDYVSKYADKISSLVEIYSGTGKAKKAAT